MKYPQAYANILKPIRFFGGEITKPSITITDPIQRIKARLITTTIIILFVLISFNVLTQRNLSPLCLLALVVGYFLSRSKYFYLSAYIVIANIAFFVLYALFVAEELTRPYIFMTVARFVPVLILAGLIFRLREMVVISFVYLLIPLSLLVVNPELEFITVFDSMGFILAISSMILVSMHLRNLLEKERQKEITNRNIELESRVQERTAELEAFSYSVSHDLRAPVRHIAGYGQILKDDYSGKLGAEGKVHLERIIASANRMNDLIDDLLKLSKISQKALKIRHVDISKMVHAICQDINQIPADRESKFIIAEGVVVRADDNLIRILLENLINNAWKFTQNKTSSRIEFGVDERNGQTIYFIKDNGVGFDPKYSERLFEPFQRLHSNDDFEGTGIGLAIVKRIVDMHSGEIWVESKVDEGAAFYFTLSK
jgi:signal transduction histidine kinase